MILIVSTCAEPLHEREFVDPIVHIAGRIGKELLVVHLNDVSEHELRHAEKIIICGTSLKDNEFTKHVASCGWLKKTAVPVLGICAGMQLLGLVYGGKLKKELEIGNYNEEFEQFLGLDGIVSVYHLHQHYVDFAKLDVFKVFSKGTVPQAVKHKKLPLYGVLFHPEVRQEVLVENFLKD